MQLNPAGAVLATPAKGALEYDGNAFYCDPANSDRGVVPSFQTFAVLTSVVGASSTSAQAIFGDSNFSTLTIGAATTYLFRMNLVFTKSAGTSPSQSLSLGFGGTATVTSIFYRGSVYSATNNTVTGYVASAIGQGASTTIAPTLVFNSIITATGQYQGNFVGAVTFSSTGTFIPQYTLGNSTGPLTLVIGSSFSITPIGNLGDANAVRVGNWT
jgi:hypothetical protein